VPAKRASVVSSLLLFNFVYLRHALLKTLFYRNSRFEGLEPNRELARSSAANARTSRACSTAKQSSPFRQIAVAAAVATNNSSCKSGIDLFSQNHWQYANGEGPL